MSGGGDDLLQMRFHFGERDRCGDGPLEDAVMDACARRGVRAAALLRGIEGFGAKQRVRTDRLLSLSEDTPLVAVAVGAADVIDALAGEVREIATEGLVVLEPVGAASAVGAPEDLVKVTVWGPRRGPASPHLEAVAALRRHGAESATVLMGVDGVVDGERRRARFVAGNQGVPAMTVGVGTRAAIAAAAAEVDAAAHLVTVGAVERKSVHDRLSLHGEPRAERPAEAVRVALVTSEVASRGAHPVYLEFIHALRREGAPGATALRGVWGYRGEEEPHGDRVFALRRDVPVMVETVDAPDGAARWLDLALSVACKGDVVHVQSIPEAVTLL